MDIRTFSTFQEHFAQSFPNQQHLGNNMNIVKIISSGAKSALINTVSFAVDHPVVAAAVAVGGVYAGIRAKQYLNDKKEVTRDYGNGSTEKPSYAKKKSHTANTGFTGASNGSNYAAKEEPKATRTQADIDKEYRRDAAHKDTIREARFGDGKTVNTQDEKLVKRTRNESKVCEENITPVEEVLYGHENRPEPKKPAADISDVEVKPHSESRKARNVVNQPTEQELQIKEDSAFPNKANKIVADFKAQYTRGDYATSIADTMDSNIAFGIFSSGVSDTVVNIDVTPENYTTLSRLAKRTNTEAMASQKYTSQYLQSRVFTTNAAFQAVLLLAQLSNSIKQDMGREANYIVVALETIEEAFAQNQNTTVVFRETVTISRNENSCDNKVLIHHVQVALDCGDEYKIISLF